MSKIQSTSFAQLDSTFPADIRRELEEKIKAWEAEPLTAPNPYEEPERGEDGHHQVLVREL